MTDDLRDRVCALAEGRYAANCRYGRMHKGPDLFDCIQFARWCGEEAGVLRVDPAEEANFTPYPATPRRRDLVRACHHFLVPLVPLTAAVPGDVLVFQTDGEVPHHVGLLVKHDCLIHADASPGVRKVTKISLGAYQPLLAFRYPGIA